MAWVLVINIECWQQRSWLGLPFAGYLKGLLREQMDFVWQKCFLELSYQIFDSVVTSVVRFGAGQRKLYKSELRKLDVHCRKLLRQVVGPPGSIDWTQPWHSILHQWNQRVVEQMELNGSSFGQTGAYLNTGNLFSMSRSWMIGDGWNEHWHESWRWQARTIVWFMGCPCDKILQVAEHWANGKLAAQDKALWLLYLPDFVTFMHM